MLTRKTMALAVSLLLVLPLGEALAFHQDWDKEVAAFVATLNRASIGPSIRNEQECDTMLDALRKGGKEIEYVKPLVITKDYHDPRLDRYKKDCPSLEYDEMVLCDFPYDYDRIDALKAKGELEHAKEYADTVCSTYHATRNFMAWELDLVPDPEGRRELVAYMDGYYREKNRENYERGGALWDMVEAGKIPEWRLHAVPYRTAGGGDTDEGNYRLYDLKQCRLISGDTTIYSKYDHRHHRDRPNYTGVFRYKDEIYFYSLAQQGTALDSTDYWFRVDKVYEKFHDKHNVFRSYCKFY